MLPKNRREITEIYTRLYGFEMRARKDLNIEETELSDCLELARQKAYDKNYDLMIELEKMAISYEKYKLVCELGAGHFPAGLSRAYEEARQETKTSTNEDVELINTLALVIVLTQLSRSIREIEKL